jgi:hypothetical protein
MGGTQEALLGASWDGDDSEHELGGEAMSVKSSFAGKPDALKPSLKAVAGRRPRVKSVLAIDVGRSSLPGNQKVGRFDPDQSSPRAAWCQE